MVDRFAKTGQQFESKTEVESIRHLCHFLQLGSWHHRMSWCLPRPDKDLGKTVSQREHEQTPVLIRFGSQLVWEVRVRKIWALASLNHCGLGCSYVCCVGLYIDRLLQQDTRRRERVPINKDWEEWRKDLIPHKDTTEHAAVSKNIVWVKRLPSHVGRIDT